MKPICIDANVFIASTKGNEPYTSDCKRVIQAVADGDFYLIEPTIGLSKGIFENWVCNREHLDKLLRLDNKNYYSIDIKELASKAEKPTGCVYGLNKIFVGGHLPLKAEENGEQIIIKHTVI